MSVRTTIDVDGGVLVAHDGSPQAESALRTGARFAAALELPVIVVRAWNISTAPRLSTAAPGYMPPFEDFETATLDVLEEDIASTRAHHPDVVITAVAVHGSPAAKVIEASGSADLVVVGSRGHGGFVGLMLGSVSEQVVRHAKCPVLVDKELVDKDTGTKHETSAGVEREQMEEALASELRT